MVPIHMVLLTKPSAGVVALIQEKYPDHHQVTETCYLVQTKDLTQDVAIKVGVKGPDRIDGASGVVFKLNGAYSGFAARTLWEWLGQAEEMQ